MAYRVDVTDSDRRKDQLGCTSKLDLHRHGTPGEPNTDKGDVPQQQRDRQQHHEYPERTVQVTWRGGGMSSLKEIFLCFTNTFIMPSLHVGSGEGWAMYSVGYDMVRVSVTRAQIKTGAGT